MWTLYHRFVEKHFERILSDSAGLKRMDAKLDIGNILLILSLLLEGSEAFYIASTLIKVGRSVPVHKKLPYYAAC